MTGSEFTSMLATSKYPFTYVGERRRSALDHLDAFAALEAAAHVGAGKGDASFRDAMRAVEAAFCANLIQSLDHAFAHRTRGLEGKDGNALNEVRMLGASLMTKEGVLLADKTIKYDPAKSVLGLALGEKIVLDTHGTRRLVEAFMAGIEAKFT